MALQQLHSIFWPGDGIVNNNPPPDIAQYPAVQAVILSCAVWGVAGVRLPKSVRRFLDRIWRALPERLWLTLVLLRVVWSQEYAGAQQAVRKIARDQSIGQLRGPHAIQHMQNRSGVYHKLGENWVRVTEAREWAGHYNRAKNVHVSSHRTGALVELAYLALKERGR